MAKIKVLKDNELVGGVDNTSVYPVTHTKAIFDSNNKELDQRLDENDRDRELLHRQSEKLVLSLTSNKAGTIEIYGAQIRVELKAQAMVETFGDEATVTLKPSIDYTYEFTNATPYSNDNTAVYAQAILPNTVGAFTSTLKVIYGRVAKSASVTINMNLRKFFGFSEGVPSSLNSFNVSHFSNSVSCTVTILKSTIGQKYKNIYFAVPEGMTISNIIQPDALNAHLAFQYVGTITRIIGNISYTYKLYKSTDLIDSTVDKRLTIS